MTHRAIALPLATLALLVWSAVRELRAGQEVSEPTAITVTDDVVATIGADFLGVHYDGPTHRAWDGLNRKLVHLPGAFGSPHCRQLLRAAGLRVARIFVNLPKGHPMPGEFDWSLTDAQVAEAIESGMVVMLCLHQRTAEWFVGDQETPWWRHEAGRKEWRAFARACAERYRDRVRYHEVLNEPNHLHRDKPDYVGWDLSVRLFMDAAKEIKSVEPQAKVGGAATWAAWESATWAKRVLARPDGERLLDFVSYHIYTSHSLAGAATCTSTRPRGCRTRSTVWPCWRRAIAPSTSRAHRTASPWFAAAARPARSEIAPLRRRGLTVRQASRRLRPATRDGPSPTRTHP